MPRDPMDELIDDLEQVLPVGEVRLDPGTTKNDEGASSPSRRPSENSSRSSGDRPTDFGRRD